MTSPLFSFLSATRSALLHVSPSTRPSSSLTLVLGNPSADLDSFISALVFAYFYSTNFKQDNTRRLFLPILNLPVTPSSELWRFRPEFRTVLELSLRSSQNHEHYESVLQQLVTIADIRSAAGSPFRRLFLSQGSKDTSSDEKTNMVLVDHNTLSIPTVEIREVANKVSVVACIDHHDDEGFVLSHASPRIIRTGIGSCTSLVVKHLRDQKIWQSTENVGALFELAKLALAPILIDTANLTAEGKVSQTDREVVAFLESEILPHLGSESSGSESWNRDDFYKAIAESKNKSLDFLTIGEILDRDYKEWNETTNHKCQLQLGISSCVKPLGWLIDRADSVEAFQNEIDEFARAEPRHLSIFGLMTAFTSEDGTFKRELLVVAFDEAGTQVLQRFNGSASRTLRLEPWNDRPELLEPAGKLQEDGAKIRVWAQGDVSQSRKQVAPILRSSVKET